MSEGRLAPDLRAADVGTRDVPAYPTHKRANREADKKAKGNWLLEWRDNLD